MFEIEGKVALVTGGASGIGLETVRKLLENHARGVILADINAEAGKTAGEKLGEEFGKTKVVFVHTDVSNKISFEGAFKRAISEFGNIDILVNNAGICNELDYEKEIGVNFIGTIHGSLLAVEKYILNHKTGSEGVVINTTSIAGCYPNPACPMYVATKSGINSLTLSLGMAENYDTTKIKVVAVAPGYTVTNIANNFAVRHERWRAMASRTIDSFVPQTAEFVATNILKIIREKPSATIWICEDEREIYEYIPPASPKKMY